MTLPTCAPSAVPQVDSALTSPEVLEDAFAFAVTTFMMPTCTPSVVPQVDSALASPDFLEDADFTFAITDIASGDTLPQLAMSRSAQGSDNSIKLDEEWMLQFSAFHEFGPDLNSPGTCSVDGSGARSQKRKAASEDYGSESAADSPSPGTTCSEDESVADDGPRESGDVARKRTRTRATAAGSREALDKKMESLNARNVQLKAAIKETQFEIDQAVGLMRLIFGRRRRGVRC